MESKKDFGGKNSEDIAKNFPKAKDIESKGGKTFSIRRNNII